jgi:hypothetical protein
MIGLGLSSDNRKHGFPVIPAGTSVELVMRIKAGDMGPDNLCKRSSNGNCVGFNAEYTIRGGDYDRRKLFDYHLLEGETAGHELSVGFTKSLLVKIFDAVHGLDPNDKTPEAEARRLAARLIDFNGATFQAILKIEKDKKGVYPDKNTIGDVLCLGDRNYRRLDQPPPVPIERSAPPATAQAAPTPNGSPAVAPTMIAKPTWAE